MKLIMESWRHFAEEAEAEDRLFNELKDLCLSFRAGTLITEDVEQKQFLVELDRLYTLYEQEPTLRTRRDILKLGAKGAAALGAASLVPGVVSKAMAGSGEASKDAKDKATPGLFTRSIGRTAQAFAFVFSHTVFGQFDNFVTQCFVDFVERRKKSLGAQDLDRNLRDCLRIIANDARKRRKWSWGDDRDYKRVATSKEYVARFGGPSTGTYNMAANMKGGASIVDSLKSRDPLNNIFNTLTHMRIKISKEEITITDIYDFNPVVNIMGNPGRRGARENPEFFRQEKNFFEFVSAASRGKLKVYRGRSKGWVPVSFLSRAGIENLSRFYEGLFNYKGYPVAITLSAPLEGAGLGSKVATGFKKMFGKKT